MKLLQLNIWGGRLLRQTIDLIKHEQPDILCLQEVFHGPADIVILERLFDNLRTIADETGYEHSFFAPAEGFNFSGQAVNIGNAILSRWPLKNQRTVFTAGEYQTADVLQKTMNIRNLQLAEVIIDNKRFTVANHHGYWQPDPLGNDDTIASFSVVADTLSQVNGPLVFAGDLNVIPASPAMRAFDGFLEDLTATYQLTTTLSELGKAFNVPCDHILVSPEIKVIDYAVLDKLVSDHKAIILDFQIQ